MGDVQNDQQAAMQQFNAGIQKDTAEHGAELDKDKEAHAAKLSKMADKSAQKNESSGTFVKLKQIL